MPRDDTRTFGQGQDPTSRLMYHDLMGNLLAGLRTGRYGVDLGGGNGLMRGWLASDLWTVDINPDTEPDEVGDARTWQPTNHPDFAVTRYTAHYWDDLDLHLMLTNTRSWTERLVSIQIVTVNRAAKERVSRVAGEQAWWRDQTQLEAAYQHAGWVPARSVVATYRVQPSFYATRLGLSPEDLLRACPAEGHDEAVAMHDLRRHD